MPPAPRAVVLGPQPGRIHLGRGLASLDPGPGPVAAITVGWRETEPIMREVDRELERAGREPAPLLIGERIGRIFERDPELSEAHRELQERLLAEEKLYRARLGQLVEGKRAVARLAVSERSRAPYLRAAMAAILDADRFHIANQTALWREFRAALRPIARPALRREKDEVEEILDGAAAAVLTGGHLAVIRNRLLLFELGGALSKLPVLAWSAGAMALSARIALFHDRLPYGSVPPEVLGQGFGVLPGIAFLPDARRRLDLEDRANLGDLAERMAPERAVLLDPGDQLDWDGGCWTASAEPAAKEPEGEQRAGEPGEAAADGAAGSDGAAGGIRTLSPEGRIELVPRLVPPSRGEDLPEAEEGAP